MKTFKIVALSFFVLVGGALKVVSVQAASPTVNFTINGSAGSLALAPGYATFSWTGANATECSASNSNGDPAWSGNVAIDGSQQVYVGGKGTQETYTVTCDAGKGSVPTSASVTVSYNLANTPTAAINSNNTSENNDGKGTSDIALRQELTQLISLLLQLLQKAAVQGLLTPSQLNSALGSISH